LGCKDGPIFLLPHIYTMGTGIYHFEGSAGGEGGKTITQICNYDDPVGAP
jgi:hypothetical protein